MPGPLSSQKIFAELDVEKRKAAVLYLCEVIPEDMRCQIAELVKRTPRTWWGLHQRILGTHVRKELRKNGFGEEFMGVENLDDVWVELVEEAVKE